MQALLHFEAIQPLPKRVGVDFLESWVVKFIMPNSESAGVASPTEREELSSIFLEVIPCQNGVLACVLKEFP